MSCSISRSRSSSSPAPSNPTLGRALSSQAVGERLSTAATLADEQLHLVLARGPDDYARHAKNIAEGGYLQEPARDTTGSTPA